MITNLNSLCTGCCACAVTCPIGCLTMEADELGFLHPTINESACINCHACETVCPVMHPAPVFETLTAYAARNRNEQDRLMASSGGVFEILAKHTLLQGGAVFGAAYDEAFRVCHIIVEHTEDLFRIKGTKYVQSNTGDCYKLAKQLLENGRPVLFSGTGCQIMGLKKHIGRDYEKLFCVDFICHGVPSPAVWQKYLDERAELDNAGVRPQSVNMRNKAHGWKDYYIYFDYNTHLYSRPARSDPYLQGFVGDLYLRDSCYSCPCKGLARAADITLGDYWGIESQHPEMDDGNGTSIVLIHTEKAYELWQVLSGQLDSLQVDPEEAVRFNPMAIRSTPWNPAADEFRTRWVSESLVSLIPKLLPPKVPAKRITLLHRVLHRLKRSLIKLRIF